MRTDSEILIDTNYNYISENKEYSRWRTYLLLSLTGIFRNKFFNFYTTLKALTAEKKNGEGKSSAASAKYRSPVSVVSVKVLSKRFNGKSKRLQETIQP